MSGARCHRSSPVGCNVLDDLSWGGMVAQLCGNGTQVEWKEEEIVLLVSWRKLSSVYIEREAQAVSTQCTYCVMRYGPPYQCPLD